MVSVMRSPSASVDLRWKSVALGYGLLKETNMSGSPEKRVMMSCTSTSGTVTYTLKYSY